VFIQKKSRAAWMSAFALITFLSMTGTQARADLEFAASADASGAMLGAAVDPAWVSSQLSGMQASPLDAKIQSDGFAKAALNPAVLKLFAADPDYTHEITTGSIMDQQNTGDCWIYSSLSVLRSRLYTDRGVDPSFQFSPNYVYFYSLVEKVNLYLNNVIRLRHKHLTLKQLQDRLGPTTNLQDGGWWENVVFLADKYGLVPKEAMPDTKSSLDDGMLLQDLADVVSVSVQRLHKAAEAMDSGLSEHEQLAQLYAIKTQGLSDAIRVIQAHLEKPPTSFVYNSVSYTPMSFLKDFVNIDFNDYVHISSYPTLKLDQHYVWKKTNIGTPQAGEPFGDVDFLNTTNDRMAELVTNSVLINYAPWIAIDVLEDVDVASGIMHPDIFDRADAYGLPLSEEFHIDPTARMKLGILQADHAVVVVGVDQPTPASPSLKFKIENSWGTSAGTKGFFHMYREWFQQYVFDVVVPRSLLTPQELQELQATPIRINQDLGG